jgi:hypothetical protein
MEETKGQILYVCYQKDCGASSSVNVLNIHGYRDVSLDDDIGQVSTKASFMYHT